MKIAATILISTFLILVLFALYQHKAKNRKWGATMLCWLAGAALLAGMKIQFNSFMVPVFVCFGFCIAYFAGWRLLGKRLSGWRRHLARATAFAICLGPLLAVRLVDLERCFRWMDQSNSDVDGTTVVRFLIFGIPGFLLVGSFVLLASFIADFLEHGTDESWHSPKHWKLVLPTVGLLLLLCANWYVAGTMDLHRQIEKEAKWLTRYMAVSRPGIGDTEDEHRREQALRMAIRYRDATLARLLIWGGADVTGKVSGVKPWAGHKTGRRRLLNTGGHVTPLHGAVQWKNREISEMLLARGAPINARDKRGKTPLDLVLNAHSPWDSMSEPFVAWLIQQGARTGYGLEFPLHSAVAFGDSEAVAALVKSKVDINGRDHLGMTPMHLAALNGRTVLVKKLAEAGGMVDARERRRRTPLMIAATWGWADTVAALLQHGANFKEENKRTRTAMHHGAEMGRRTVVKLLLEAGASPNGVAQPLPPLSLTLFFIAKTIRYNKGQEERKREAYATADLLIENGASVNERSDGNTIMDLAVHMNWPAEITDYIRRHGGKTSKELEEEAGAGDLGKD